MFNVIGDIAGNYKTLIALLEKMPSGKIISVGDIVDRGPRSKEVIEFFMNNKESECLMGNHEHMMFDFIKTLRAGGRGWEYRPGVWLANGGFTTFKSFNNDLLDDKLFEFLEKRPLDLTLNINNKKFYISHTFSLKPGEFGLEFNKNDSEIVKKLWNRGFPYFTSKSPNVQVCGHNSQFGLRYWRGNNNKQAICIDTSKDNILTGICLPSLKIYQQEYID